MDLAAGTALTTSDAAADTVKPPSGSRTQRPPSAGQAGGRGVLEGIGRPDTSCTAAQAAWSCQHPLACQPIR
jgi:hypothetical protein